MLKYTTDRARSGLVAFNDIRPGNGVGQFLQPRSPHGAVPTKVGPLLAPGSNFGRCHTHVGAGGI